DFGHAAEHTPGRGARRPKTRARRSRRRPPASGRLPAPSGSPPVGEELVELPGREPRDAAERLLQVAVWVEPESPTRPDDRVQDGRRPPARVATGAQVVLAAGGHRPHAPL